MRPHLALTLLVAFAPGGAALAQSTPAKKTSKSAKKPGAKDASLKVPSFEVPITSGVPRTDNLKAAPAEDPKLQESSIAVTNASWSVVRVQHAKRFVFTPTGVTPTGPLSVVQLKGDPPTTEKFATAIRVKSEQRAPARIEVAILDPRGDTALSATGDLTFDAVSGTEVEYLVDWIPTACRSGGDYQVLVRLNGRHAGTWPLKVELVPAP